MLKPYMIFSRLAGSEEGAALVFAHTAREARNVGWRGIGSDITDEFTDLGVQFMRGKDWLLEEADAIKLANDTPHVIDAPTSCVVCELWGGSPIGDDKMCEGCRRDRDDEKSLEYQMEADMETDGVK